MRVLGVFPILAFGYFEENILIERLFNGFKLDIKNTTYCQRKYGGFEVEDVPDSCVEYVKELVFTECNSFLTI